MRALTYLGPWEMAVTDRRDPTIGDDDVLISVIATGVCGSDVHGYTGETGRRHSGQVMGHETVGRIVDQGGSVPGHRVGEVVTVNPMVACGVCAHCRAGHGQRCAEARIFGVEPTLDGAFADYLVAPAANAIKLADGVPEDFGALVEPLAVGYHAATCGSLGPDDTVLVIGGGPIGQACAIATRRIGVAAVLVSEVAPARRDLLAALGFDTTSPATLEADVERNLGGRPTAAIDAVGTSATLTAALANTANGARVVLVGMEHSSMTIPPYELSVNERTVTGSYCYSREHFASTVDWLGEAHGSLGRLISDRRPLGDGPSTFRGIADGTDRQNKVLLRSDAPR